MYTSSLDLSKAVDIFLRHRRFLPVTDFLAHYQLNQSPKNFLRWCCIQILNIFSTKMMRYLCLFLGRESLILINTFHIFPASQMVLRIRPREVHYKNLCWIHHSTISLFQEMFSGIPVPNDVYCQFPCSFQVSTPKVQLATRSFKF